MSGRFSERERQRIRTDLLEQGRMQFAAHGLKKTSIAELTRAVGIAQGTFYQFFGSKEELYLEVLQEEEERLRTELLNQFFTEPTVTREHFRKFLRRSIDLVEHHPLIRQLYDSDLMRSIWRKMPEKAAEANFQQDVTDLAPLILRLQNEGRMRRFDPEIIVSLIRALVLLALKKKEIGEQRYDATMELLVDLVTEGLFREDGDR